MELPPLPLKKKTPLTLTHKDKPIFTKPNNNTNIYNIPTIVLPSRQQSHRRTPSLINPPTTSSALRSASAGPVPAVVKRENFKISLTPEEEKRLLILETTPRSRPVLRRQNTKPQLTEEDRGRIQEHAQKVIQRENVNFQKASSDSAILFGGEETTMSETGSGETHIPRTKINQSFRKTNRGRTTRNKSRRPRSISPPPGASSSSLLLTPRQRKSLELPLPNNKKRKTAAGGNLVGLPAMVFENYHNNNNNQKTPRIVLTAKSGPASSMKNSIDTIGGPSVMAASCVGQKPIPTKQFLLKSRDSSRPSFRKIKHHRCVHSYTGPENHKPESLLYPEFGKDSNRNLKIGYVKPPKNLLKNRPQIRVINNIKKSYSQQNLPDCPTPVEGESAPGIIPSNDHSILRKRSKLSTTVMIGENMDELKENSQNNNNLGHSLISEKRIASQRGHIEKKICIKNEKRMTWIL